MNKYQEALNTMCKRCINHEMCQGTGCQPKNDLQELVDLAIPKKPVYKRNRIGDYEYFCASCGERFPYIRNCIDQHKYEYCPYCGKKADWSNE